MVDETGSGGPTLGIQRVVAMGAVVSHVHNLST